MERLFFVYSYGLKRGFAKFTRSFLKQKTDSSEKGYCYHVSVMKYALIYGETKDRDEKDK